MAHILHETKAFCLVGLKMSLETLTYALQWSRYPHNNALDKNPTCVYIPVSLNEEEGTSRVNIRFPVSGLSVVGKQSEREEQGKISDHLSGNTHTHTQKAEESPCC